MPQGQSVIDEASRPVGELEKGGRGRAVDCKKFQRDLKDVGIPFFFGHARLMIWCCSLRQAFRLVGIYSLGLFGYILRALQKMVYAISEKVSKTITIFEDPTNGKSRS